MTEEKTYYQDASVLVTNSRVILQGTTYAMTNITSVKMISKAPSLTGALIGVIAGALGILCGIFGIIVEVNAGWLGIVLGVVFIGGAIFLFSKAKATYVVIVGSTSGEKQVFTSTNKEQIQKIIVAINQAIVERG